MKEETKMSGRKITAQVRMLNFSMETYELLSFELFDYHVWALVLKDGSRLYVPISYTIIKEEGVKS